MKKHLALAALSAAVLGLSACGGGDDDPAPANSGSGSGTIDGGSSTATPPPQPASLNPARGYWLGQTIDQRQLTGIVLGDGTHYVIYSAPQQPEMTAGVVLGKGTARDGTFTSDAYDFNLSAACGCTADPIVSPVRVTGAYEAGKTLNGTMAFALGTVSFSTVYSAYYEQTPQLSDVAGSYQGVFIPGATQTQNFPVAVSVSASGALSATIEACTVSGTLTPRTEGNAFDVSLSFGAGCLFANQTLSGGAIFNPQNQQLSLIAPTADHQNAAVFQGQKPAPQQ